MAACLHKHRMNRNLPIKTLMSVILVTVNLSPVFLMSLKRRRKKTEENKTKVPKKQMKMNLRMHVELYE